jgi:hypothetical protein
MQDASAGVIAWWISLSAVSVLNMLAWIALAVGGRTEVAGRSPRWQLWLSAVFVAGCAFRSFSPLAEAQRICLLDSWVTRASITRSVATVAELAMVAQCSLALRRYARAAGFRAGVTITWLMVPTIAVAEVCSWYTALTTNFAGSIIEESLWTFTFAMAALSLARLGWSSVGAGRVLLGTAAILCTAYVGFMATHDVPMYVSRWRAAEAGHAHYFAVGEGWADATQRRIVTRRWEDWREEVPWMSLYFSAGVWVSLALAVLEQRDARARRDTSSERPAP